jgi:hypothetical protein
VTLVARLALEPPLAADGAASRPVEDKRVVQLRPERWTALERGKDAGGRPLVVLVRIRTRRP